MKRPRTCKVFEKPNDQGLDPFGWASTSLKKLVTRDELNAGRPNLQDLIETVGKAFFEDRWWKHVYGREIPYFARALQKALFVEDWRLRDSPGFQGVNKTVFKEAAARTINLGEQTANDFIALAVQWGLFSESFWEDDLRTKVIHFTPENLEKARKARQASRIAAEIIAAQLKEPNNLEAGKTEENAPIHLHFMTVISAYKTKKLNDKPE